MKVCRIGNITRCVASGCEWKRSFGTSCDDWKDKEVSYSDQVMNRNEWEKGFISHLKYLPGKKRLKSGALDTNRRRRIYKVTMGICYLCGKFVPYEEMTVDHVIPRSKGGSSSLKNLRPTHRKCNSDKGDKLVGGAGSCPGDIAVDVA